MVQRVKKEFFSEKWKSYPCFSNYTGGCFFKLNGLKNRRMTGQAASLPVERLMAGFGVKYGCHPPYSLVK